MGGVGGGGGKGRKRRYMRYMPSVERGLCSKSSGSSEASGSQHSALRQHQHLLAGIDCLPAMQGRLYTNTRCMYRSLKLPKN